MPDLAQKYSIPPELMRFIDEGFLVPLSEHWDEKYVEFHLPSKVIIDTHDRVTSYSVVWIHPDYNVQFCHYYENQPGDLPNFFAVKDTTDIGDDPVDDLNTIDDLIAWLESMKTADVL